MPSRFSGEIMELLGPEPSAVVAWSEQATVTEYAGLAPVVLDYAEAGDLLAEEILANGARQVDALVRFLVEFGASRISLLRGLATRVAHWLSRDVLQLLLAPDGDAVAGALLMAPGGEPVSSPQPSGQNRGCKVC